MPTTSKHPETIVLHGGNYKNDESTNAVAVPIYQTTSAIDIWKKLIGVLEIGEHRPGHFKAVKK